MPPPQPPFDPAQVYPNGGIGFYAALSGHQLPISRTRRSPSAPPTPSICRGDPIDKLNAWTNINLSLLVAQPAAGLQVEVYGKNLLNSSPKPAPSSTATTALR